MIRGRKLGEGSYGDVFKFGSNAIKIFKKSPGCPDVENTAEIDILFRLHSKYLLHGVKVHPRNDVCQFSVEMELMTGNIWSVRNLLSPDQVKSILLDYAYGVKSLHDNRYLHLDIGLSNATYVFENNTYTGKIIDFGLAVACGSDLTIHSRTTRITAAYRPRSNLEGSKIYSGQSDIWSLGLMFIELMTGREAIAYAKPVYTNKKIDFDQTTLREIKRFYSNPSKVSFPDSQFTDLIRKMLFGPRATIDMVVQHPFFKSQPRIYETIVRQPLTRIKVKFTHRHSREIIETIKMCLTDLGECTIELLFVALDVYMRTGGRYSGVNCVILAFRLFYPLEDLPDYDPLVWETDLEDQMLLDLEGILRRPYIYSICTGMEALAIVLDQVFLAADRDTLNDYHYFDLAKYKTFLPVTKPVNVSIAQVMAYIDNIRETNLTQTRRNIIGLSEQLKISPPLNLFAELIEAPYKLERSNAELTTTIGEISVILAYIQQHGVDTLPPEYAFGTYTGWDLLFVVVEQVPSIYESVQGILHPIRLQLQ